MTRPQPDGLAAAGAAMWHSVADVLALEEHEALALVQVCRTADVLDGLQAILDRDGLMSESSQGIRTHPALTELRAQRVTLARLMAALQLPTGLAERKAKQDATEKTADGGVPTKTQRRSGARGVYAINGGKS